MTSKLLDISNNYITITSELYINIITRQSRFSSIYRGTYIANILNVLLHSNVMLIEKLSMNMNQYEFQ